MEDLHERLATARRLIKNQLRHHVTSAKVAEDPTWDSVAFVNQTALRNAREDWHKLPSWAGTRDELVCLILDALREATQQVQEDFREHFPVAWLDKHLGDYLEAFQPEDLL